MAFNSGDFRLPVQASPFAFFLHRLDSTSDADAAMLQLPALVRVVVRIARSPQNRSKKDTKNPSSRARDG